MHRRGASTRSARCQVCRPGCRSSSRCTWPAGAPLGALGRIQPSRQHPSRHLRHHGEHPTIARMKTCWFHLMPYRFLPENFENDYRSVWVDVPQSLYDGRKVHDLYNEYLDELEHAERSGFDGLCVNEHHQNAYGLMPSPNLMAAALSRRTSKVALVVLGNSLALYNPPVRVAEEFAMLDTISGGRLVAGFPVGTSDRKSV